MFRWLKHRPAPDARKSGRVIMTIGQGGPEYRAADVPAPAEPQIWLRDPGLCQNWELVSFLSQLETEGAAVIWDDAVLLSWGDVYGLLDDLRYEGCRSLLELPPASSLKPRIDAQGSISGVDFEITLDWLPTAAATAAIPVDRTGAVVLTAHGQELLSQASWRLVEAIRAFARRSADDRNQDFQERRWGEIRSLGVAAGARMSRYLEQTVVVTAATLNMGLRRVDVHGTSVVEVLPCVDGAPDDLWLAAFDRYGTVQEHYDLTPRDGKRLRVILEPEVREVLSEVKLMPGRRIAGRRAERFLRNPYGMLGEAMQHVVPPERFETARDQAGIYFTDFAVTALRELDGRIRAARLSLLTLDARAPPMPNIDIVGKVLFQDFVTAAAAGVDALAPCFRWGSYSLELRGDAADRLTGMRALLAQPWSGDTLVSYADLHDLSRYSARVAGIGIHKPQYVPFIGRKDVGSPWLPDNLDRLVEFTSVGDDPVFIPVTPETDVAIRDWLAGEPEEDQRMTPPGWPSPVSPNEAREILQAFEQGNAHPPQLSPTKQEVTEANRSPGSTVNIRQNVRDVDYAEARAEYLKLAEDTRAVLPQALKPDVTLLPHQETGVAWLQNLWARKNEGVTGALLADDMGLGKTLQLLVFIAWYLETAGPLAQPVLVVAPVSLLDNWKAEVARFFTTALSDQILLLYGSNLDRWKIRKSEMDAKLVAEGIRVHLRPGWTDGKTIVLTTYETLRDLAFAFSSVQWSIMVCDEAQKIKSPSALVTHVAKAQKTRFKIACTGTPVENSLADLWCLFDFFQSGLLGSLSAFCRSYRRPIESGTDADRAKLDELRHRVEPQVLRRLKSDVAQLPPKLSEPTCRTLVLSPYQRTLYRELPAPGRGEADSGNESTGLLGMLHRLRSICADPRVLGTDPDLAQPLAEHRSRSPKLDWLIRELERIQSIGQGGEKVIIFTEFRDLQRLLQHRIRQRFGFSPAIINGSTKAGADAGERSRQSLIDRFQSPPGFGVIILSTTAVGFGVNIQAANHVIHFTRCWNPAKEDQATDRAYRIGQNKAVTVYTPTVVATDFVTFEAKLDQLLESKRKLATDMLNGTPDISIGDWSGLSTPDGGELIGV